MRIHCFLSLVLGDHKVAGEALGLDGIGPEYINILGGRGGSIRWITWPIHWNFPPTVLVHLHTIYGISARA